MKTAAEIKLELDTLQREYEQTVNYEKGLQNGDPDALANFLHERFCRSNHTDACSYYYTNDSKKEYLDAAKELMFIVRSNNIDVSNLISIIDILGDIR